MFHVQVHSSCSGSLGTNVAVFFYDKCRTANIYVSDSRYYSVQVSPLKANQQRLRSLLLFFVVAELHSLIKISSVYAQEAL